MTGAGNVGIYSPFQILNKINQSEIYNPESIISLIF